MPALFPLRFLTALGLGLACGLLPAQVPLSPLKEGPLMEARARKADRVHAVAQDLRLRRSELGVGSLGDFTLQHAGVDIFGQTHARFEQRHGGLKVWGGEVNAHLDAEGRPLPEVARVMPDIRLQTEPSLSGSEAEARAREAFRAEGNLPMHASWELVVVPETRNHITRFHTREGEAPNAAEVTRVVTGYRLAYHVSLRQAGASGLRAQEYMVDAHRGAILRTWSALKTAETQATGTGKSAFYGTVSLATTQTGPGSFLFKDTSRPILPHPKSNLLGNAIYDGGHRTDLLFDPTWIYTDPDNTWGDGQNYGGGSTTSNNGQVPAVDAGYGLQVTWDFFGKVFNRKGLDGKGTTVAVFVHAYDQLNNAAWDTASFTMIFGDGKQNKAPLTWLDVTAHEFGHGVLDSPDAAQLYYGDESGGLNESNSDILGTLVEHWALTPGGGGTTIPNTVPGVGGNWTIGEASGQPIRYMYKPSLDGQSPDVWSEDLGTLDVHQSSGPMNRAFYFLSQGASGDPSSDRYSKYLLGGMTGLGNDKAGRIWFRAMTSGYMLWTGHYVDARQACIRAATDLYGAGGVEVAAVRDAFAAIQVGLRASEVTDQVAPAVSVTVQGGPTGPLTLEATATDNVGVAKVEFWVDEVPWGTATQVAGTNTWRLGLSSTWLPNRPDHSVLARAFDAAGNLTVSSRVTFEVNNPVSEGLYNGDFESGNYFWTSGSDVSGWTPDYVPLYDPTNAHGGRFMAGLGIFSVNNGGAYHQYLDQEVQVPASANTMALSYWIAGAVQETATTAVDTLQVQLWDTAGKPLTTLKAYSNLDVPKAWTRQTLVFDASAYAGKSIRVAFDASENDGKLTQFFLDDITLTQSSRNLLVDGNTGDVLDLAVLARSWGHRQADADWAAHAKCDLNGDGVVDDLDLDIFLKLF